MTARSRVFLISATMVLLSCDVLAVEKEHFLPYSQSGPRASRTSQPLVVHRIPLDDTGVANWKYLNPRNPWYLIDRGRLDECWKRPLKERRECLAEPPRHIIFENRSAARSIYVQIDFESKRFDKKKATNQCDPADVECRVKDKLGGATKNSFVHCRRKSTTLDVCTISMVLEPSLDSDSLPLAALLEIWKPTDPTRPINFSVGFRDEAEEPTNKKGYLWLTPPPEGFSPTESSSATQWKVRGSVAWNTDPDLDPDGDGTSVISPTDPYAGARRRRFRGAGGLDLGQNMGDRASASLSAQFKNGDFGSSDDENDLEIQKWQVNIFAKSGLTLRFGDYDLAKPSENIAISETGEAWELFYRNFSFGNMIKRESATGIARDDDDDDTTYVFQWRNAPFGGKRKVLRSYSVVGLWGEDEDPAKPHKYRTAGGEIRFGFSRARLAGTLAWYFSKRSSDDPALIQDGEGNVGLLVLTRSWLKPNEKDPVTVSLTRSITFRAARGTGDDPSTSQDEGYIGETAAFAPDKLFLSTLAPVVDTEGAGQVSGGLTNKRYLGVVYTEKTFSLLDCLARAFNIKSEDIASKATIVRLHDYRFNEDVFGSKHAGREFEIEFQVETPKDIRVSLSLARFFVGDALEPVFTDDKPWRVHAAVAAKFK